jgi:hypothetical protein
MLLAYIDPGLGALIWQAIVAGVVGFLFYLKKTRQWIAGLVRKMFGRSVEVENITTKTTVPVEGLAAEVESENTAR